MVSRAPLQINPRDTEPLLLRDLMNRGASLQPDNLIITKTAKGHVTSTYREHQDRSERLASALAKWGLKVGDRVGTLLWNTGWHLNCYHALSCMGAVLHTLNLRLGPTDLSYIIGHASDRVIFVDADMLPLLAKVDAAVLAQVELFVLVGEDCVPGAWKRPDALPAAKCVDFDALMQSGSPGFVWPDLPETATHALCYTSGTTGNPKGAAYSQRSTYIHTLVQLGSDQLGVTGSMVILPFVPMFHVLSWGVPFAALTMGAPLVLNGRFMDPKSLIDLIIEFKVELSTGVPTVWQGVKAEIEARGVAAVRPGLRLRTLTCGGSAPPAEMMRWFYDELQVQFIQGWGMTETNPLGSLGRRVAKLKDLKRDPQELFKNITKAGLPTPGIKIRIANPDDLDQELPQGEAGELLVRGPYVIQGYFQVDAPDKFHKGWLITGDVAKIDEEGALVLTDRSKDVVKSGGEWISSIDLENCIAGAEGVAMAAVVAVPHPKWDERPVAVVVLKPGAESKGILERVHAHCSKTFAKFQWPDDVMVWDAIPMTSTGKIDKKVIRSKLQDSGYVVPTAKAGASKL